MIRKLPKPTAQIYDFYDLDSIEYMVYKIVGDRVYDTMYRIGRERLDNSVDIICGYKEAVQENIERDGKLYNSLRRKERWQRKKAKQHNNY